MATTSTNETVVHYDATAKLLHWLVAGAIVLQFVLAKLAERAHDSGSVFSQLALLANHKSVGMTILIVAIGRLVWRLSHRPPPLPATMPTWQRGASHVSHFALYALLFALPITGWLMSSASAYSVSWFNLFQFPDLVAADADLKHQLEEIHETLGKLLFVVALVHILAALKHALFDRDGILRRISSAPAITAFTAVIVSGLLFLAQTSPKVSGAPVDQSTETTVTTPAPAAAPQPPASSALPVWELDDASSRIEFVADQAGASFTGTWERFEATLQFDNAALEQSRFDVTIDTTTMATNDAERDDTLTQKDWFDVEQFPQAFFRATAFEPTQDGFVAHGQLVIKAKSVATDLMFSVTEDGDKRVLNGTATLDRLALGVGTGEWTDTTWVGQTVIVKVHIEATVN
ncbi:MAG: YceI family protein [Gammaproteobacteria bacterium]